MKKINWNYVFTMIIIIAMMFIGAVLSEEEWYETTTTVIWITGMILVVEIFGINEFIKYLKNRDK